MRTGTIEKIEFTSGGFGNQFTTINGHRYYTWFDLMKHKVRVGATVRYTVQLGKKVWDSPLVHGDVATIHEVLENA